MADVRVEGMKELGENLRKLPLIMKEKIARGAIFAEAKHVQAETIRIAPVGSPPDPHIGLLRESIRVARRNESDDNLITYVGYVKGGARPKTGLRVSGRTKVEKIKGVLLPYYWYFLEFGTSKMDRVPLMRFAFDASAPAALKVGYEFAKSRFDREMRKQFRQWKKGGMPGLRGSVMRDMSEGW